MPSVPRLMSFHRNSFQKRSERFFPNDLQLRQRRKNNYPSHPPGGTDFFFQRETSLYPVLLINFHHIFDPAVHRRHIQIMTSKTSHDTRKEISFCVSFSADGSFSRDDPRLNDPHYSLSFRGDSSERALLS